MVKKSKIRSIFLLPSALIIFLIGWSLQFTGSSKMEKQGKKLTYDMQIEVSAQDEPQICQPIRL
jgi:hypothetical protein